MEKLHSDIESVRILVSLLVRKGIRNVVLSPGSRNAPLLISIAREKDLTHEVIVDERSAAFFALGIAQQTGTPVALVCTSGTALLNYAPAVAEAYYQGVPLIIISADRPVEWIDQDDSQTIRQENVLQNLVKQSFQLPVSITCDEERWHTNRMINEAINQSREPRQGPVHINIPLREPLYGFHHPDTHTRERILGIVRTNQVMTDAQKEQLQEEIRLTPKVMIIAGFCAPDLALQEQVELLASLPNVVVLSESVSNLTTTHTLSTIDRIISTIPEDEQSNYAPDLLISFGGAIISRMIKAFIRNHQPRSHWHIDERTLSPDTYKSLTLHVKMDAAAFFSQLTTADFNTIPSSGYACRWAQKAEKAAKRHDTYLKRISWSDLKTFSILMPSLPVGCHLQLGNSTPIRYAQLFRYAQVSRSDANRGTSGIDGCMSTALGAATTFQDFTVLIIGDNSFMYDSNALWIKNISPWLRVIVIQNGGGGIFRFLPGPSVLEEVEEYFETPHQVDICKLAETHHFSVYKATDESSLQNLLPEFFRPASRPAILVIETPGHLNGSILKEYFIALQQRTENE